MKRWLYFLYGIVCYALFFAVFLWMAAFIGGFGLPKTIDTPSGDPLWLAVLVNLVLMGLFAAQHSVMARPAFKDLWTSLIPRPIERSTYVLLSNVVLALLMWQWRGIDIVVWNVEQPVGRAVLWALFAAGWLLVPAVSYLINHFDLFGMRQVWLELRGKPYTSLPFGTPLLYRFVRHPLYLGWMLSFWAIPRMTVGHLLFAAVMSGYMVAAAVIEERDLVAHFGREYAEYRKRVPMFVPRLAARNERSEIAETAT